MSKALVLIAFSGFLACCHASRVKVAARRHSADESNVTEDEEVTSSFGEFVEEHRLNTSEESGDQTEVFSCNNYCVQCNDGSTVWYGRSKNWWKAGASSVLGVVGGGAVFSGIGVIGGAAAVAGAGVLGHSTGVQSAEEKHSHWSGSLPSSGFFCEKVNVFKYLSQNNCENPVLLMEKSVKRLGRVKNNMLKPYETEGPNKGKLANGFQDTDIEAYKNGCKVVKGAGTRAFKQLSMGPLCAQGTTKGIQQCSEHSRLCGVGGVAGITNAETADSCQDQCKHRPSQQSLQCPNDGSSGSVPSSSGTVPLGSNYEQPYGSQPVPQQYGQPTYGNNASNSYQPNQQPYGQPYGN
jgi:hypothetical protein